MSRQNQTRRLSLESLESRQLMAGDLDVRPLPSPNLPLSLHGTAGKDGIWVMTRADGSVDCYLNGRFTAHYEVSGRPLQVDAGDGDDLVVVGSPTDAVEVSGGNGNDRLIATSGNVAMYGEAGNDVMRGGTGDDRLFGGDGNDLITGGDGHDFINGGTGDDRLFGNNGNDLILGGDGNDYLEWNSGRDLLDGQDGDDQPSGGEDADVLRIDVEFDLLHGERTGDLLLDREGHQLNSDFDPVFVQPIVNHNQIFGSVGTELFWAQSTAIRN